MIGIYGGSFDPPHLGHLGVIQSFWKEFSESEKLLIVPNFISPFKKAKGADTAHILKMLDLLILEANVNKTQTEDYEIKKESPSFTVDTIDFMREKYFKEELCLLIGVDNLKKFPEWKGYKEILKNCKVIVFDRDWRETKIIPKELKEYWDRFIFLQNPPIKASSSEIRANIVGKGNSLLSKKIQDYIMENKLYGYRKGN